MDHPGRLPSEALAEFVASTPYDGIPRDVLRENKRHLLDTIGVAVGARRMPAVSILVGLARDAGRGGSTRVLAQDLRAPVAEAARILGVMSHVLDFDDTHIPTILHPSGPALAAALSLADARGASGKEFLAAFAMGIEAGCRVALALGTAHYDVGWHVTGTAGALGAAAAAARVLGLDAARTHAALSIAASQAAGLRSQFGTMTKSLHTGNAAANGVTAALLAEKGYTASREGIEGRRGLLTTASSAPLPEELADGLGERWEVPRVGIKPYACGVVIHPGVDAVRELRRRTGAGPEEVEAIELDVDALVLELTNKRDPRTGLEGKFSIAFASAITWLEGTARQAQFTDEKVNRPEVRALRDRVSVQLDPALDHTEARATVRLRGGRTEIVHVTAATGTPGNPISDSELRQKFEELVAPELGSDALGDLLGHVDSLEAIESAQMLVDVGTDTSRVGR